MEQQPVTMPTVSQVGVTPKRRIPMEKPDGTFVTVDEGEYQSALEQGYVPESPLDEAGRKYAQEQGDVSGAAQVFVKNAINQGLFGVPEIIENKLGDPFELAKRKALEKKHGMASVLGDITGFGGSLFLGAPVFKAGELAGKGVAKALGKVIAADSLGQVGAKVGSKAASDILKRMAVSTANYGTQGAVQMAPQAITEAALGDIDAAAESLLWGASLGGVFGGVGVLGGEMKKLGKEALAARGIETLGDVTKAVGKKAANVLTGTPEEALERYIQRGEQVTNAKPFEALKDEFLTKIDDAVETVSVGSSEGYKILERAGKAFENGRIAAPIDEAAAILKERGKYSPEMRAAAERLDNISTTLKASAEVPALEARRVMDQLREEGYMIKRQGLGAQGQIGEKIRNAASKIDTVLKTDIPGYAEHMVVQAANTKALKEISSKFRSEGGAQNLLKRIMRGKDDTAIKAIKAFDEQYATNMYEDLLDSFTLQQLSRETTQGSRKTLLGTVVGGSFGGPLGGMLGAGAGAIADKYGGHLTRKAVDGILLAEKAMRKAAVRLDELPGALDELAKFVPRVSSDKASLHAALRLFGEEPKKSESKEKVYERLNQRAYELVQNPEMLSNKVAQVSSPFQTLGAPEVGGALNAKMVGAHEYLVNAMPKEMLAANPFSKRKAIPPSKRDLHGFFQKAQVLEDPFSVIGELKRGTLTKNHMDALKTVYPRLHSMMQKRVRDSILKGVKPIPYDARIQLSLLMDEPYDLSLTPESVKKSQAAYAQENADGSAENPGASFEGNLATPLQSDVETLSS